MQVDAYLDNGPTTPSTEAPVTANWTTVATTAHPAPPEHPRPVLSSDDAMRTLDGPWRLVAVEHVWVATSPDGSEGRWRTLFWWAWRPILDLIPRHMKWKDGARPHPPFR